MSAPHPSLQELKRGHSEVQIWRLASSNQQLWALLVFSALVIAGLFQLSWPDWAILSLVDLLVLQACYVAWFSVSSRAITELRYLPEVDWHIGRRDGSEMCCELREGVVTAYMVVLILQSEKQRLPIYVVVWPDSLEAESFRRLRVLLKWRYWRLDNLSA